MDPGRRAGFKVVSWSSASDPGDDVRPGEGQHDDRAPAVHRLCDAPHRPCASLEDDRARVEADDAVERHGETRDHGTLGGSVVDVDALDRRRSDGDDVDEHRLGNRLEVRRVVRRECDGQGLARTDVEDRSRGGVVDERARHGCRGVERPAPNGVPARMSAGSRPTSAWASPWRRPAYTPQCRRRSCRRRNTGPTTVWCRRPAGSCRRWWRHRRRGPPGSRSSSRRRRTGRSPGAPARPRSTSTVKLTDWP